MRLTSFFIEKKNPLIFSIEVFNLLYISLSIFDVETDLVPYIFLQMDKNPLGRDVL